MKHLFKSILAGIMISIGGCVYLSLDNKVLGAIFFGIGLFAVVTYNFNLYTGKIGYLVNNFNLKYIKELIITLIGNFIGTFFIGFILRYTRIYTLLFAKAKSLVTTKLDDNIVSILILSFLCGLLMYFAVNGYKTINDMGKYLAVFLGVIVFILCGFEHCVANMFYFTVAKSFSVNAAFYMGCMIIGNSLGGVFIPLCDLVINNPKK